MNEKFKIIYSPEALNDLRKIYSYIAFKLKAPDTARNQALRIRKEIRSLGFMPDRYVLVDFEPWKSRNTHKVTVNNYVVFYAVDEDLLTVTVIRIFYGGQDIENILKSE